MWIQDIDNKFYVNKVTRDEIAERKKARKASRPECRVDTTIGPSRFVSNWHKNDGYGATGKPVKRTVKRKYEKEFIDRVCDYSIEQNKGAFTVAKHFDIPMTTVQKWFVKHDVAAYKEELLKSRVLNLHSKGVSQRDIAKEAHTSCKTARRIVYEAENGL